MVLTIGALALRSNCSVPTIRYYEQIGLIPHPQRAANGHRYFRQADLTRLTFIKRCRDFGFPIEQVRDLVLMFDDGNRACSEVRTLAQTHLDQVRLKLHEMRELEASLSAVVANCDATCSAGLTRDCVIAGDILAGPQCSAPSCSGQPHKVAPSPTANSRPFTASQIKRQ